MRYHDIKGLGIEQDKKYYESGSFEADDALLKTFTTFTDYGTCIINPFKDESAQMDVYPTSYYGIEFLKAFGKTWVEQVEILVDEIADVLNSDYKVVVTFEPSHDSAGGVFLGVIKLPTANSKVYDWEYVVTSRGATFEHALLGLIDDYADWFKLQAI